MRQRVVAGGIRRARGIRHRLRADAPSQTDVTLMGRGDGARHRAGGAAWASIPPTCTTATDRACLATASPTGNQIMDRRSFLLGTAGAAALPMGAPALAQPAGSRMLRFIPQAELAVIDPILTTAYVTRHHGFLIYDTLYGIDAQFKPQPQMAEGHVVEEDGRRVTITLRQGLKFHDGSPVLARDAVASIKRWWQRDAMGQALAAATDELAATDDRTLTFRLKKPFALLFDALAKPGSPVCFIMPERIAHTDANTANKENVGSGPFRFKADERVPGSLLVYERNADYVPREGGKAEWTSGPKVANFDRVEWRVIPDASTAAGALQSGEMDWYEQPTADLLPLLKCSRNIKVENYGICSSP